MDGRQPEADGTGIHVRLPEHQAVGWRDRRDASGLQRSGQRKRRLHNQVRLSLVTGVTRVGPKQILYLLLIRVLRLQNSLALDFGHPFCVLIPETWRTGSLKIFLILV